MCSEMWSTQTHGPPHHKSSLCLVPDALIIYVEPSPALRSTVDLENQFSPPTVCRATTERSRLRN